MLINNKFLFATMVTALTLLMLGCVKEDKFFDTGSGEQNRVMLKFMEAPEIKIFFEPFNETRNVHLFSLRRDANNTQDLNQSLTVNLTVDTAAIRAYNTANNESFKLLPDSLYTLVGSDFTKTGPITYQATFAPGEISKEFNILLNGSKWDLSQKYTMPFIIDNTAGVTISSGMNKVGVFISIKNQWDGVYSVTGTLTDVVAPTITGEYPLLWDLVTSGPNQVIVYDKEYTGTPTHIIRSGTALSQYGSFGLIVNFDPVTNKITSVTNFYGQFSGGFARSAALDPTGENRYDPATKTIYIKYFLQQGNPPTVRTTFDEVWTYTGPR